jgi:hypothetical protein
VAWNFFVDTASQAGSPLVNRKQRLPRRPAALTYDILGDFAMSLMLLVSSSNEMGFVCGMLEPEMAPYKSTASDIIFHVHCSDESGTRQLRSDNK